MKFKPPKDSKLTLYFNLPSRSPDLKVTRKEAKRVLLAHWQLKSKNNDELMEMLEWGWKWMERERSNVQKRLQAQKKTINAPRTLQNALQGLLNDEPIVAVRVEEQTPSRAITERSTRGPVRPLKNALLWWLEMYEDGTRNTTYKTLHLNAVEWYRLRGFTTYPSDKVLVAAIKEWKEL
jgi:hypothetical protein